MKLTIIVISKGNDKDIAHTHKSIISQTRRDFEYILVQIGRNSFSKGTIEADSYFDMDESTSFFKACNLAVDLAKGEYCLFLKAGDCLANDRIVEELFLNELDAAIVCGNTLVYQHNTNKEEYIITPNSIRASHLILNQFPYQGILFKRSLFSEIHLFNETLQLSSARLLAIEALLLKQKTYKHVNLFVSRCTNKYDDRTELMAPLVSVIPSLYQDYADLGAFQKEAASERTKVLKKFGNTIFFRFIYSCRENTYKLGLYKLKAKLKQRKQYREIEKADKIRAKDIEQKINELPENLLKRKNDSSDIIVSLTSFGHRVVDSVPLAIYSLFTQKRLPNRIILFLDHDNWNEDNVPTLLKRLQKSGLEIMFCEDLRSYKKLIPILKLFPDNVIITVDDDVLYNDCTISELLYEYENSDKKSVICHWAFIAEKRTGKFIPYSQWKDNQLGNYQSFFSAVGKDGVLYPPGIFDSEIFNSIIFRKLAPSADDIWFWIQEYRNNIKVLIVRDSSKNKNLNINTIEQWVQKGSTALYFENAVLGKNDIQLENLLDYYKL
jgi:hypothetical protein